MHNFVRQAFGMVFAAMWKVKLFSLPQRLIAFTLLCCVLAWLMPSNRVVLGDEAIEVRVSAFINAQSNVNVRKAVKSLFENATETELVGLRHHQNDRVAIYAAWETVLRQIESSKPSDPGTGVRRMSGDVAGWLTGFVEGRLKTTVPAKWTTALKSADFFPNRSFQVPVSSFWKPSLLSQPDFAAELRNSNAKPGADLRDVRNNISMLVTNETINQAMEKAKIQSYDAVTIEAKTEIAIIVLSDKGNSGVIAIHAKSGKVLWISRIVAIKSGMSGIWSHSVECVIENDKVLLFGVFNSWCYVYVLNRATGAVELEFDSTGL